MKWLRNNIYWLSFLLVFIIGLAIVIVYCLLRDGFKPADIELANWLRFFAASGTVGAFTCIVLDRVLNDSKLKRLEWQDRIPFVTIGSPCSPLASYCDINILANYDSLSGRGNHYFCINNLGKIIAYKLTIKFSTSKDFIDSNIFNRHYIPYLPPFNYASSTDMIYGFSEGIHSNYNVNPDTLEVSNSEFKICNCLNNCETIPSGTNDKRFFVQIEYYSTINTENSHKITSIFQVDVVCTRENLPESLTVESIDLDPPQSQVITDRECVYIKGIQLLEYIYE